MNDIEFEKLWKRLQATPPAWKDIYDTYQEARSSRGEVKRLQKQLNHFKEQKDAAEKREVSKNNISKH